MIFPAYSFVLNLLIVQIFNYCIVPSLLMVQMFQEGKQPKHHQNMWRREAQTPWKT